MTVEAEHVPKTATLKIVLEGREVDNIREQIDLLLDFIERQFTLNPTFTTLNHIIPLLREIKVQLNIPPK